MRYADNQCVCTETYEPNHVYTFTGPCVVTGETYSVTVPAAELYAYRRGLKIQDAMPSLDAGDREFLMSGFSPAGWDWTFGSDSD